MINYPIKKDYKKQSINNKASMGMALEEMINKSNNYYKLCKVAYINKRPTNIKVIKTEDNYKITDGFFLASSLLDYVGVYKGRYLDFEAKESKSSKGFPMNNIASHQLEAIKDIIDHGGISFVIVYLRHFNEIYLLDGSYILSIKDKIIPYEEIIKKGYIIKENYNLPVDYIPIVNKLYFD